MYGRGLAVVALVAGLLALTAPRVFAGPPTGACCLAGGACVDVLDFQCTAQNGDFVGFGTSCASVECAASVKAPLLSIGGIVATLGALAALGTYRLTVGRRR